MSPFTPKRLSYHYLGQLANDFLNQFYPQKTLPVPIEEIAETKLNLEIVPINGIRKEYDVDGCLDSSFKRIYIDFDMYMRYENRTRFTIAHEIGHLIIHKELFQSLNISSPEDIYNLSTKISDEDYGWMEFQAYSFAGHILVPKNLLESEIKKRLDKMPQHEEPEKIFSFIQDLPEIFKVSGEVMLHRLQKEGIVKSNS